MSLSGVIVVSLSTFQHCDLIKLVSLGQAVSAPAIVTGVAKVDGCIKAGQQSRVQILTTVGGTNDDTLALRPKSIHLAQQHPQQPPRRLMHLRAACTILSCSLSDHTIVEHCAHRRNAAQKSFSHTVVARISAQQSRFGDADMAATFADVCLHRIMGPTCAVLPGSRSHPGRLWRRPDPQPP